jgi:endoglycosylceramidase
MGPEAARLVSGPISAPGGPFLRDRFGRTILLHGVNAVYKLSPYVLYPAHGKPYNFSSADAVAMARLGFNVVRLGITWQGIEPGTVGPNDPAICSRGRHHDPGQWNAATARAYLDHVRHTVDLLGKHHIYTLLDMHQDVYSAAFGGDGAPPWAVCTNGMPPMQLPGRWSRTYGSAALRAAFGHFWRNDVVGNLQGQYDRAWSAVASTFRNNPWVLGYDLINEPFSTVITETAQRVLDAQIECLYTGRLRPGRAEDNDVVVACPPQDGHRGLIPTIERIDRRHLLFFEPDIYANHDGPNYVGPMDFPNLVFNFHSYCPGRDPVTGDPRNVEACALHEEHTLARRAAERGMLQSDPQPNGPPWFLSEWGATSDPELLESVTAIANRFALGWAYWQWKQYRDPTGSSHEALVSRKGRLGPQVAVLSQTYPEATAGTPTQISFDPDSGQFLFRYQVNPGVKAPTVIFVPLKLHYPHGHCVTVTGGRVIKSGSPHFVDVANGRRATTVTVTITKGHCV